MSQCLDETRIRAVADDEGTAAEQQHAAECAACRAQVEDARRVADDLTSMMQSVAVPAGATARMARRVLNERAQGATTLRERRAPAKHARIWMSGAAVAAAAILVIVLLPPPDAPRDLSAAEVLDRSLQTLSPASGTELREFELDLQLPSFLAAQGGRFRIEQLIDHDAPGRYRVARFARDGTLLDAVSEDPAAGERVALVHVDGQPFAFRFKVDPGYAKAMRELERAHVEAVLRLVQTMAGQTLREVDTPRGKRYVVEIPRVSDAGAGGFWAIEHAKVVVDAENFQVLELNAAGSYMGEKTGVSFRLRRREMRPSASVPAAEFEVPAVAGAVAIAGQGTSDLMHDIVTSALRELARARH
jgi:hypothetical protein